MSLRKSWGRAACPCAALVVALLASDLAMAETSEKAAAEALFQTGRELIDSGDAAAACPKFEASQRLDPALGTMLHLADCYDRIGKFASAWALFEEAASLAASLGQSHRAALAAERSRALQKKVPRVTVHVPTDARIEGLELSISSIKVPPTAWDTAVPVDPGEQTVVASAPGRVEWRHTVHLSPEQSEVLEIPLLEALPAPVAVEVSATAEPEPRPVAPIAPLEDEDQGRTQRIAGWVMGGAGLASLTAGAILGGLALSANEASLQECRAEDPTLCSPTGVDLRDDAERLALGSTVTFAASVGLVAAGIVVYFTAPSPDVERVARSVGWSVSSDGGAWWVGGAW
jgi:hypothetical protein